MQPRFRALRIISTVFRVLAWVVLAAGAVSAISTPFVSTLTPLATLGVFLGSLILTAINVLVLFALAEVINLAISIEDNTYHMREELGKESRMPKAA